MAELADAQDSGSCPGNWVEVQILSRALIAVQVVSFLEIALIIDGCGMEYGETKTLVHAELMPAVW